MASIKGIQLKAVNTFTGHEGYGFTSNLYMDNKKIGRVQDLAYGGQIDFYIDEKSKESEFYNRVEAYFEENPAYLNGVVDFFSELFGLWETEEQYKKNIKKGFPITVHLSFHKRNDDLAEVFKNGYQPDIMLGVTNEIVLDKEIKERKPKEYHVYRSREDFIIE